MTKVTIELPDEVVLALDEEAVREFRSRPQQASYLLLTWAREGIEKRQKEAKAATKVLPNGTLVPQPLG